MNDRIDSSHDGNGRPGRGIVFPAVEKLLSAVNALIDLDVGGAGPSGRALALVTRRQNELINASAKCDAKVFVLRRQLAAMTARAEAAETKLAACERERDQLFLAVVWALGCEGSFDPEPGETGAYWWRAQLRKRSGLEWDGEKNVFRARRA